MQQYLSLVSQQQHPAAARWHRQSNRKISAPRRRSDVNTHRIFALQQNSSNRESSEIEGDNVFVRLVVAAATETLRIVGVGSSSTASPTATAAIPPGSSERPAPGDIPAVLKCLRSDYEERSYFITGVLSDGIYDEECYFADPTVSFTGRELWKKNLQLLVPFLIDPSIQLTGLKQLDTVTSDNGGSSVEKGDFSMGKQGAAPVKLRADWILKCSLKLPWKPYIKVIGTTEYDLASPDSNRIVRHVEFWDISAWEALLLVFTPGKK